MQTFLTAEWRKLAMAQYAVPPELLTPWLPAGVELDLWQGRAYVSLVGFLFDRTRVKGIAFPFHTRFEEVNLRFYVRQTAPDGTVKRGVVFISELVPKLAIALVARTLYEEPYSLARTRSSIHASATELTVGYDFHYAKRWHALSVTADPTPLPMLPGSEEEFITEHYWGYTRRSSGATSVYQVEHPRWQHYSIRSHRIDADFGLLYGPQFAFLNTREPDSILLAEGSPVTVYGHAALASWPGI